MSESDQPPSERTIPDRLHDALAVPVKIGTAVSVLYVVTFVVLPGLGKISWLNLLVTIPGILLAIAIGPMAVLKLLRWMLNTMASEYRK